MKRMKLWMGTVLMLALASCGCKKVTMTEEEKMVKADIVLDWNCEGQVIDGFGVAQAGWSDYLYAHRKREEVMDVLFGEEGLRLSILRGEVFPHYDENTFNMDEEIDMPLDDPFFDIDYSNTEDKEASETAKRKGQLWITKRAKDVYGVDKLVFSTWSAPARMKSNGKASKGKLKKECYQDFADYLSDFCDAYEAAGLPVYAISPVNEPEYPAPWNSCVWLPGKGTLGRFIIENFGPTMAQSHPDTRIIFGENAQWTGIMGFLLGAKNYTQNILELKKDLMEFPLIAAGHGYRDPVTKKTPDIEPFDEAEELGMPVWLTEISDPYEKYDVTMTSGLKWAELFHRYLSEAHANAIVWWAGALPDGGTTEGLINIHKDRVNYEVTKRCEVFGNFSRYIPVGSRRMEVVYDEKLGYLASAFKYGKGYTAVLVNGSDVEQRVSVALKGMEPEGEPMGYLTDDEHRWAAVECDAADDGQTEVVLPARSVLTLVGRVK